MKLSSDFEALRQLVSQKPSHLLDESSAAKILLERFDTCCADLASINVNSVLEEWKNVFADRDVPSLTEVELNRGIELQTTLEWYERCDTERVKLVLTLAALTFFVQNKTRNEILNELSAAEWITQHEVLTRWGWMISQKIMKEEQNADFNYLYQCEVGERDGRQNLDREFYTFLHFLPKYCEQTKTMFLFLEKGESPDFVIIDQGQNKIGIEVTEAPLNATHAYEQKERERFFINLRNQLSDLPCSVTLLARPDPLWSGLNKDLASQLPSMISAIKNALSTIPSENDRRVKVRVQGFVFNIKRSGSFEMGWDLSEPEYYGDFPEKLFSTAVSAAVKKKLRKKVPEIRPCILVVYANTGLIGVHHAKTASLIRAIVSEEKISTHFDQVYFSTDQECIGVIP